MSTTAGSVAPYFVTLPASSVGGSLTPFHGAAPSPYPARAEWGLPPTHPLALIPAGIDAFNYSKDLVRAANRKVRNAFSKTRNSKQNPTTSNNMGRKGQGGRGGTMKTSKSTSVASVSQNVRLTNPGPRTNSANGITRIQHKEFVVSLSSSIVPNSYAVQGLAINPGLYSVFPWLANTATSYDEYKFLSLWFEVIPVQPTTSTGKYGLALDRNSQDPLPSTRQEFYSTIKSTEGSVWERLKLPCPTDGKFRFVDTGGTVDTKLVDLGQIEFFSDQLVASNTPLGELIVHYDVLLRGPQTPVFGTLEATEVAGVVTTVGPPIANVTYSSGLVATVTFLTTGTFVVNFIYVNSSFSGTLVLSGSATIDPSNNFEATTGAAALGIAVVQATAGQTLTAGGTTGISTSGGNRVIVSRVTNRIF